LLPPIPKADTPKIVPPPPFNSVTSVTTWKEQGKMRITFYSIVLFRLKVSAT